MPKKEDYFELPREPEDECVEIPCSFYTLWHHEFLKNKKSYKIRKT